MVETRRGWVPQPVGLGNQAPTMDDAPQIVPHLAPEGRHVYRTATCPSNQSPRGATGDSETREENLTQRRKDPWKRGGI